MNKENPLKQYFRRPALYLKLPSNGVGYGPGVIEFPENNELPVYPMTAIDEITSRTPDALYNGVAVVEIIKSCVPSIKQPWEILNIDLDPILVAIRMATNGTLMDIETICVKCEESSKYDVNLTALLSSFKPGDYNEPLVAEELQFKFRPLSYKQVNSASEQQFEVQRLLNTVDRIEDLEQRNNTTAEILKKINEMSMDLMIETVEYIKTPDATVFDKDFIREFLSNCDKNLFNKIRDKNIELRKSTELKPLHITCINCQHEYDQPFNINIANFFD